MKIIEIINNSICAIKKTKKDTIIISESSISKQVIKVDDYSSLLTVPRYTPCQVSLESKKFEIPDSISFYYAHKEIFENEIYKFSCDKESPTILDCGANVGISVVYFKNIFPKCRLTAVEADPSIYEYLKKNIDHAGIDDVRLIQKAVSSNREDIQFHHEGADGGRVLTDGESDSNAIAVKSLLLDDLIDDCIDFLKIDIEGAETGALMECTKLNMVDRIFFEYHSFRDHPQSLHILLSKITDLGFRYYVNSVMCPKNPYLKIESTLGMDLQLNVFCVKTTV